MSNDQLNQLKDILHEVVNAVITGECSSQFGRYMHEKIDELKVENQSKLIQHGTPQND